MENLITIRKTMQGAWELKCGLDKKQYMGFTMTEAKRVFAREFNIKNPEYIMI